MSLELSLAKREQSPVTGFFSRALRRRRPEAWPMDEAHSACSSRFRRGTPARGRARGRV
jgi:hypothetical protein